MTVQTLRIGKTEIPYVVRFSGRAKKKRIVVTPGRVEVVAPAGCGLEGEDGIEASVRSKRKWLLNAVEDCRNGAGATGAQRYLSGAKLLYRGRRLMLKIQAADVETVEIECRSRFWVKVPRSIHPHARESVIGQAFEEWLRSRALSDVQRLAGRYARKLGADLRAARISDQKRMWGACGRDRVVRINWRLVQAPLAALDYVVAHEVCHLLDRSHSPAFWRLLGGVMPDWRERKAILEEWEREHYKTATLFH